MALHSGSSDHYNDVKMGAMASQITRPTIFTQPFTQAQIKENIKDPSHWPLFPIDDVIMKTGILC